MLVEVPIVEMCCNLSEDSDTNTSGEQYEKQDRENETYCIIQLSSLVECCVPQMGIFHCNAWPE